MRRITLLCMLLATFCWQTHAQFTESFDTEIPATWAVINNDGGAYTWEHQTSYPHAGGGNVVLHWESSAHDDYLISPSFMVASGVSDRVSFFAGGTGTTFPETFEVKLSTSGTALGDFTISLGNETTTADVYSGGDYEEFIYDLSAYDGQNVHIAIIGNSTDKFYLFLDEFSVSTPPSCLEPSGLVVDAVGTDTADISWAPGGSETAWNISWGTPGYTPGDADEIGTATTSSATYEIDGLSVSTNYEAYVQADCGGGDESAWAGPLTFSTACGVIVGLPYTENFDTYGTGTSAFPNCWERPETYMDFPSIVSYGSSNSLKFRSEVGIPTYAVSPAFAEDIHNLRASFILEREGLNSGTMDVGVMSDPLDPSTFELVQTIDPTNTDDFLEYTINFHLTTLSGGGNYIALRQNSDASNWYYWLDDFVVELIPSCLEPSNLIVEALTAETANVSWTMGNAETAWNISWGTPGYTPGDADEIGTATASSTVYQISSLMAETDYEFYVQADCGAGDLSTWTGPVSFTTECIAEIAPYVMDFEVSMTEMPNCWNISSSESNGWEFDDSPSSSNNYDDHTTGSGYFAYVDASSTYTPDATMTTALVDVSGLATPMLEFYVHHYSSSTAYDSNSITVEVYDGTAWNQVYFDDSADVDAWEMVQINLSTLTITGAVQARFIVDAVLGSNFYNDIGIDDILFGEMPTCPQPINLNVGTITASTAELIWTENGTATTWDIEIVDLTAGETPSGTADFTGVTDNPYTVTTGLNPVTDYEFYVRADCGAGDLSEWSGPYAFTTPCAAVVPDYTENFDTFVPDCWEVAGSGTPTTGPSGFGSSSWLADEFLNTGTNMAVNINLFTTGKEEWLISPSIDISAGSHELSYVVAATDYNNSDPIEGGTMGSDDEVQVLISEDNGTTWTNLMTYNAANTPSNTGDATTIDLSGYTGVVKIAFWATEGTVDDEAGTYDYDFFVDDFSVLFTGPAEPTMAYAINNATQDLVSFDVTDPSTLTVIGTSPVSLNFENAGAIDPANPTTAYVLDDQGEFYSVDLTTGVYTSLGTIAPPGTETWTGMAFDPISGTLYAVSADGITSTLSIIDIAGVSATNIGVTGMALAISVGIDANGDLYGHDIGDDNLYLIDKTTGVGTIVGYTGFDANYGQGMAWDYNTNTMYMAAFNFGTNQPEWRSVNTFSGNTTLIGTLGDGSGQFAWVSTPGAVITTPACPSPVLGSVTGITQTGADLGWTENGTATSWDIEFGPAGFDPTGTPTDTGVTNPFPASGLSAATSYEFYVRADCGSGTSAWSGPYLFVTECGIIDTFPFTETFEDTSGTRSCWTNEYVVGNFDWNYVGQNGNATISPRTGALMAEFRVDNFDGNATKLVSPAMDLTSLTNPQLEFYYANVGWSGDVDQLRVFYKTSATGTWTQIGTDYIAENLDWSLVILSLPNPSNDYYIAFEGTSSYGRGLNLDDVWIGETPSCPKPVNLAIDFTSDIQVDFSWDAEPNANLGYEWFIFTAGANPATDTPIDSGTTAAGVTSASSSLLSASTMYDIYVQANCDADGMSELAGPLSFETEIAAPVCGGNFYDNGGPTGNYEMNANNTTVITPVTPGDVVTVTFTAFEVEGESNSAYDALYVYDGPDTSAPLIDSGNPPTLSGFPAGGYYGTNLPGPFTSSHSSGALTFVFMSDDIVAQAGWEADVTCGPAPACYPPTGLSVTPGHDTADLSWDITTTATNGYEWFVFLSGDDPELDTPIDTGTTTVGVSSAQATGLTAVTMYDFYVQSDCGADGMSNLAGPISFETLITPPVNDNLFDAIPLTMNAECSGDIYTNVGATAEANEPAGDCWWSGDGVQTSVWFSFVAPTGGSVIISTDYLPGVLDDAQIAVYGEPTDLNDLSTLPIAVVCDEDSGVDIPLMNIIELNGLTSGETYYIQLDGYSGAEGTFCITVMNNACPVPTNIGITEVDDTSAIVSWTPGGSETEWEVEYGTAGFTPGTGAGTIVTVTPDPTTTLSNLDPETSYDVYVTANCGTEMSPPVGPASFTTFGPDQCGQSQMSNNFENGLFMEEGGQLIANDFIVPAGTINFAAENITANLLAMGGIASVDILFLQDNAGLPGAQIGSTIQDLVPTSQNIIGTAFSYDVHEVVLELPNPQNFTGSTTDDVTYWIQIVATPNTPATQVAWEVTSASVIGNETAYDNLSGTWNPSAGNDGVFTILGSCTYMGVENQVFEGFTFYPNPVKHSLSLKATSEIEQVEVFNLLGQSVLKTRPNSLEPNLNLSELQAGAYLMKVTIDGQEGIYRLIKE